MAKGSRIIINAWPDPYRRVQGKIKTGETPKPGTILQIDISEAPVEGLYTWELYNADISGGRPKGPFIILLEDLYQGRSVDTAYVAGDLAFGIIPTAGERYNLLVDDESGTADDHTKGNMYMPQDTSGKMILANGTAEVEVAQLQEDLTDITEDTLAHFIWTGY